jgi:filamentous hemagglutinin
MLAQLQLDGSVTQKRLGDGYYEQSLIRAQVTQLTGQRYLADSSSDDDEYRSLMDAGVAYAKTWNLRPGVALSADQMAALTGDMVWLVEQSVTLADSTVQKVLVPQLYVRVRDGDLDGSGALLAGKDVAIRVKGDLSNTGTIVGRDTLQPSANNVQNVGGQIHGDAVSVAAKTDLNNIGGVISANSALFASAGRDINVETTNRSATSGAGTNAFARTTIDRVAGLYVTGDGATAGGTLAVSAGRDLNL